MDKLTRAALAALVAVGFGCGGGSVALDDLDDEVADSYCDVLVRCGTFESKADCLDFLGGDVGIDPDLIAGVENGTIDYDGDAARDCLDALSGQECSALFEEDDPEACDETFTGTLAEGAGCFDDAQCESGVCDEPIDCAEACCEGTCGAAIPDAEIGDDCSEADCVAGAYCDETDFCVERKTEGTPCFGSDECASGLMCTPGETMATCEQPPEIGDPCIQGEECAVIGLTCDFSTGTCQAVLHEGDDCNPESDLCSYVYLYCDAETSVCTRYPGAGEACERFSCNAEAWCDIDPDTFTGTCVAKGDLGATCERDGECLNGNCGDSGTCEEPTSCIGG